jgi:hypothetical protein
MTASDQSAILRIGSNSGTQIFTGSIDQVKLYNYIRTPAQIAYDYNRGGPVGWWKMDECQGSTIFDSSGNGNNGTWSGSSGSQTSAGTCTTSGTAWGNGAAGRFGASLNFDGTDDFVDAGNGSNLSFGTGDFSIATWVKPNGAQGPSDSIVDKYNGAGYFIALNGFIPRLFISDGGGGYIWSDCGTQAVPDGQWSNLTFSFTRSGNAVCYINGTQTGTVDISAENGSLDISRNLYIGRETPDSRWFRGQIDDVRIYNYALTKEQVGNITNEGSALRFGPSVGSP